MIACSVDTNTSTDVFQCGKLQNCNAIVYLTLSNDFQNSIISELPTMRVCTVWLKRQGTEWHFAVLKCTVQSMGNQYFLGESSAVNRLFMTAL